MFYVYTLTDPRDGAVFYVGKGKGRRAWCHEREAKRNAGCNAIKRARITAILAAGHRPAIHIVADGLTEDAALKRERQMITEQRKALTNVSGGSRGPLELIAAGCGEDLRTLKPLCTLVKEGASRERLAVWRRVVGSLAGMRARAQAI